MFYSLTGEIVHTDENSFAVSCSGVAFNCFTTLNTLMNIGKIGEEATVYTYLNVREDALDLFGFYSIQELDCFKLLISVSGVGPKAALQILSQLTPDKLALSIASGDVNAITKAQGVGPKLAQRVILELKNKFKNISYSDSTENAFSDASSQSLTSQSAQAVEALITLGYSRSEASSAVSKLDSSLKCEELITKALKSLI